MIYFRYYLPTGKLSWLCEEHQKTLHVRVLNDDVTASVSNQPLTTECDVILKQYVEKYTHLREKYRTKKDKRPPTPSGRGSKLEGEGMSQGYAVISYCFQTPFTNLDELLSRHG